MNTIALGSLLAIVWAFGAESAVFGSETRLSFVKSGVEVQSLPLEDLKKKVEIRELVVWEPHEDRDVTYRGFRLTEVLEKVYGSAWKSSELVLFVCADGYKAPVPRVNLEGEDSLLAFERVGAPFTLSNRFQNEKKVELAPLYLVWNNKNNALVKAEGGTYWPYQVIGIELTDFAAKFPKMTPPKNSNASVKNGFKGFQKYCMSCHQVHGDGGTKGPPLMYALETRRQSTKNPKESREWLTKWISEPSSIRPSTTMPALNKNAPKRAELIGDIIAYLEAMAAKKP